MSLIFLDVGTHEGHTLEEVTRDIYKFDHIYGFEPMPYQFNRVSSRFGHVPHLTLFNYGLSDMTGPAQVYGNNENLAASIYPSKIDTDASIVTLCQMRSATEFFDEYLKQEDTIIMKLNCEGAEVPILCDLMDSGRIFMIDDVMIDFDIRRVAGFEDQEEYVMKRMAKMHFTSYSLCEDVMVHKHETHPGRIGVWLKEKGLDIYK